MHIFQVLLLLFLLIPILEIYLLIEIGGILGTPTTVFLVVFTAVFGALLLRHQGLYTLNQAREGMARGELPTMAIAEGVVLLISGALLLTPGFFTDTIGFLGLVPFVRRSLIRAFIHRAMDSATRSPGPSSKGDGHQGPRTIEGEYRREDRED